MRITSSIRRSRKAQLSASPSDGSSSQYRVVATTRRQRGAARVPAPALAAAAGDPGRLPDQVDRAPQGPPARRPRCRAGCGRPAPGAPPRVAAQRLEPGTDHLRHPPADRQRTQSLRGHGLHHPPVGPVVEPGQQAVAALGNSRCAVAASMPGIVAALPRVRFDQPSNAACGNAASRTRSFSAWRSAMASLITIFSCARAMPAGRASRRRTPAGACPSSASERGCRPDDRPRAAARGRTPLPPRRRSGIPSRPARARRTAPARDQAAEARDRQAALEGLLALVAQGLEHGIDQHQRPGLAARRAAAAPAPR